MLNKALCGLYGILPVFVFLLGAFLLRLVPDLTLYYLAFAVVGMSVGAAPGCVHVGAVLFRVDPFEHPFRAFYAGFGLELILAFVPMLSRLILPLLLWWGFGGMILALLGYNLPEDDPGAS